jgi:hypothetical protein
VSDNPAPVAARVRMYAPSGRIVEVVKPAGDRVLCRYTDDGEEVVLFERLLKPVHVSTGPRR